MTEELRNYIIKQAKEAGITPVELGYAQPDTKLYESVIDAVKQFIKAEGLEDSARENIPECHWAILGIEPRRYKVVEVTLAKTIYRHIKVALPEDEPDVYAEDLIEDTMQDIEVDDRDDEEEWEVGNILLIDSDYLASQVRYDYSETELYNYNDFDAEVN